jgi:hypothetical protein
MPSWMCFHLFWNPYNLLWGWINCDSELQHGHGRWSNRQSNGWSLAANILMFISLYSKVSHCNSKRSSDLPRTDIVEPPIRRHHKYHNHYNHLRRLQAEANSCNYCGRPKQQPTILKGCSGCDSKTPLNPQDIARLSIRHFAINPKMEVHTSEHVDLGPSWAIKWAIWGPKLGHEAPTWMRTKVRTTDETFKRGCRFWRWFHAVKHRHQRLRVRSLYRL